MKNFILLALITAAPIVGLPQDIPADNAPIFTEEFIGGTRHRTMQAPENFGILMTAIRKAKQACSSKYEHCVLLSNSNSTDKLKLELPANHSERTGMDLKGTASYQAIDSSMNNLRQTLRYTASYSFTETEDFNDEIYERRVLKGVQWQALNQALYNCYSAGNHFCIEEEFVINSWNRQVDNFFITRVETTVIGYQYKENN